MLERHPTDYCEYIFQMTDQHLENMILLVCRQIQQIKLNIEKHDESAEGQYRTLLYGGPKFDVEEAVRLNRKAIKKLYPYLAEAYLRGLNVPRANLIEALGRDSAVNSNPQLGSGLVETDGQTFSVDFNNEYDE